MTGTRQTRSRLSDYMFPAVFVVGFIVFGSLPYLYGYSHTPDGMRFTGFVGRGVFGINGYMMLARQAQHGQWLFENLMTPEPVPRVFFDLEWWLFGRMAAWTGLSLVAVFHIWRVAIVAFLVFSAWYLLRLCFTSRFQCRFALSLIVLGSGFGWILFFASRIILRVHPAARALAFDDANAGMWMRGLLFPMPLDVKGVSLPAYLINQPHFVLATALAILTYAFLLAGERAGRVRFFVLSGTMAALHALVRPYNIPETMLVFLLFPVLLSAREGKIRLVRFRNYGIAAALFVPVVIYYGWLSLVHAMGSSKGPTWPPGYFVDQVLWLGLPFLVVCLWVQGLSAVKSASPPTLLLGLWLALAFVIEQAHNYYNSGQEASFPAYIVAPAILATAGPFRSIYHAIRDSAYLQRLVHRDLSSLSFKRTAAVAVVLLCMPSFAVSYVLMFKNLGDCPAPYYISEDLYAGFQWLARNANTHDTVLASFETSELAPWLAGIKTFQGHYMITPNAPEKRTLAERFYHTKGDDAFKRRLAAEYGLHYVIVSPLECGTNEFNPSDHPWLDPCFSRGSVRIFRVRTQETEVRS